VNNPVLWLLWTVVISSPIVIIFFGHKILGVDKVDKTELSEALNKLGKL
jgi:hypothetical protein